MADTTPQQDPVTDDGNDESVEEQPAFGYTDASVQNPNDTPYNHVSYTD